jgi:hypothetical protein
MPRPKPHDSLAVRFFGASHVIGGIYMLPDGEYCTADGMLYGQQPRDEYHGIWDCWRCGGVGLVKVYLHRGYVLSRCDVCQGSGESGLMPALQPRHVHDWQPTESRPGFEPQACDCSAVWLKKSQRRIATGMLAGMKPLASLLQWEKGV